jgi:hypothetical protein
MVRPSTWHTPSALVTGKNSILGSFDARRAHSVPSDVPNFKEQNTGNTLTDNNVKEHDSQVPISSVPLELSSAPIAGQSTTLHLESSASVQHDGADAVEKRVAGTLPTRKE